MPALFCLMPKSYTSVIMTLPAVDKGIDDGKNNADIGVFGQPLVFLLFIGSLGQIVQPVKGIHLAAGAIRFHLFKQPVEFGLPDRAQGSTRCLSSLPITMRMRIPSFSCST